MLQALWICSALLAPCLYAQQTPFQQPGSSKHVDIWHRVISYASGATDSEPAWSKRGSVALQEGRATWTADGSAFATLSDEGDIYQIGFAGRHSPLDTQISITNFVSVPECHLHSESSLPQQDTITLNLRSKQDIAGPSHLSYFVAGADTTRCQPGDRSAYYNTTIRLALPDTIDAPRLHQPVVVNYQPDGTVKEPEPEKSFIQKYWMWLVPIVLLLLTSGGGGDEAAAPASG